MDKTTMMKKYIEKYDEDFFKSLTDPEKLLYMVVTEDTIAFQSFCLRESCKELLSTILRPLRSLLGK